MWSAIGLATNRQLRVAGVRFALPLVRKTTAAPAVLFRRTTVNGAVVLRRSFGATSRDEATATSDSVKKTKSATKKSATGQKKPAAKKPAAKKKKPAAKKKKPAAKKKVVKKVVKKKEIAKSGHVRLKREAANELKKIALYDEEPTRLPEQTWNIFLKQKLPEGSNLTAAGKASQLSEAYNALSPEEKASLVAESEKNKIENDIAYKAWLLTHTPARIYHANVARRALKKISEAIQINNLKLAPLKDDRFPARPAGPYAMYLKTRSGAADLGDLSPTDKTRRVSQEWNSLPASGRKPYTDESEIARATYEARLKDVFPEGNRNLLLKEVSYWLRKARSASTSASAEEPSTPEA